MGRAVGLGCFPSTLNHQLSMEESGQGVKSHALVTLGGHHYLPRVGSSPLIMCVTTGSNCIHASAHFQVLNSARGSQLCVM